jgi:hypothetical protein
MSLKLLPVPDRRGAGGVRVPFFGACVGPTQKAAMPAAAGRAGGDRAPSFADQMHGDFPVVGRAPMLEEINTLPGSQRESAIPDRNGAVHAGQGGADVRGHVVGAFVCVTVSPGPLRRQAVEERLEIGANVRRRVLLNEQSGRGVPAEQGQEPGSHVVRSQPIEDIAGNLDEPAPGGSNWEDGDKLTHIGFRLLEGHAAGSGSVTSGVPRLTNVVQRSSSSYRRCLRISATIRIGDERNAPIGPQSQVQKASDSRTARALSSK